MKTDVRVRCRIFWKVRNTGVEAAQDNGLRGEIREGTRDAVHTEQPSTGAVTRSSATAVE